MQTTKRTTGLRTAAADYETLVQQAINKVTGFLQLYKDLERGINVSGKSISTLTNYSRHLAHLALHYNQLPTELDGMRYACRLRGTYPNAISIALSSHSTCQNPHKQINKLPKVPYNRDFMVGAAHPTKSYLLAGVLCFE